jgi:stearoyl-CoA desaturase (delta-9 desaturase)
MINWLKQNYHTYKVTGQIPAFFAIIGPYHLLALIGIIAAYFTWSWYYLVYFVLGYVVFGGIGDAVILHRHLSHNNVALRPRLKPLLYWIACMTGQGSPIWWAALHRGYHHAYSDKEKDLHSPMKGKWSAYMGWMLAITHDTVNLKYAATLLRDKHLIFFHKHYNKVIWATLAVIFTINPMFCLWFVVIPCVFALHSENAVNLLCHLTNFGYRNFDTNDMSQNVWFLGFFSWGQGWHNNHHSCPKSFDFGTTVSKIRYEFDPCMLLLLLVAPWSESKRIWKNWREQCVG